MENERANMLDMQRKINSYGGMRAMCILSFEALQKTIEERLNRENSLSNPSLIVMDYFVTRKYPEILPLFKSYPKLAGVPLFFTVEEEEDATKEEYYLQGAMVVLKRPINQNGILRIERAAWQYETTKTYERIFQKQMAQLESAKEIQRLNIQLESRNEFLRKVFGKYFSDDVIRIILEKPDGNIVGGIRREVAIMMSDLRGFSSKSELLRPGELTDLLNYYFGAMVEEISKYKGTVIEFMGDGILAVFGAPIDNEHYAQAAIAAAISMQNVMQRVNAFCKEKFGDRTMFSGTGNRPLEMGIGIHCGEVFVGNVGTENMMRYNVIGRAVNECSRIEGCSVGGQVLVSENIINTIQCRAQIVNQSQIAAKGIRKPINIFEIGGIDGEYECYLDEPERTERCIPELDIQIEIYPIHNKLVDRQPFKGVIREFGVQDAIVEVVQNSLESEYVNTASNVRNDGTENASDNEKGCTTNNILEMFADVEVHVKRTAGLPGFNGVYAKVISKEDKSVMLRFTHWNKEFVEFVTKLANGRRIDMVREEIKIQEVTTEQMKLFLQKEQWDAKCVLFWAKDEEDIQLMFHSDTKSIRALEFMDYLVENYAMVKGNETCAQAVITPVFLKVMMSELEADNVGEMLEKIVDLYYTKCQWIDAKQYVEDNREEIVTLPVYVKRRKFWAYVKTTDIVPKGQKFYLKSLENESEMELEASDDLYVMIGNRGETYHISKEKFENTYEVTEEKLDIYEQMLDYLPEVRMENEEKYVSLDELAHLCIPKATKGIYVSCLISRTKVFNPYMDGDYFMGREGDYMAIRTDDLKDIYIIQKEIFLDTYEVAQ